MEKCINHPDNIAVETCKECSRFICGLHEEGYCVDHGKELDSQLPGRSVIIFFVLFSAIITTVIGSIIAGFLASEESSEITQSDAATSSESFIASNFSTIIFVFASVAIPIITIIAAYLIRMSNEAKEPELTVVEDIPETQSKDVSNREKNTSKEKKFYYCQNCGQKLTFDDDSCTSCGKDTSDEKSLIS